ALGLRAEGAFILPQTTCEKEPVMFTRLWHRPGTRDRRTSARHNRNGRACRPSLEPLEDRCLMAGNVVLDWNAAALAATAQAGNPPPVPPRPMARVPAAVPAAVTAIEQPHEPYAVPRQGPKDASPEAAAAAAAHRTLVGLYPDRWADFDARLADSLAA